MHITCQNSRFIALGVLLGCMAISPVSLSDAPPERLAIGRTATDADIARWNIDVGPDGDGLPVGSGTPEQGEQVFAEKCAGCHGADGQRGRNRLAGPADRTEKRSVGNSWPYATTLFDYIRRAMPPAAPGSLTDAEVYALTARILYLNSIIDADARIDARSLPKVRMPARDRFVPDDRRGGAEVR